MDGRHWLLSWRNREKRTVLKTMFHLPWGIHLWFERYVHVPRWCLLFERNINSLSCAEERLFEHRLYGHCMWSWVVSDCVRRSCSEDKWVMFSCLWNHCVCDPFCNDHASDLEFSWWRTPDEPDPSGWTLDQSIPRRWTWFGFLILLSCVFAVGVFSRCVFVSNEKRQRGWNTTATKTKIRAFSSGEDDERGNKHRNTFISHPFLWWCSSISINTILFQRRTTFMSTSVWCSLSTIVSYNAKLSVSKRSYSRNDSFVLFFAFWLTDWLVGWCSWRERVLSSDQESLRQW